MEFDVNLDDIESKKTKRRDDNDKENEIEVEIGGVGDNDHMKESQEEEGSTEMQAGPGGFAGLIANLSGVIYLKLQFQVPLCNILMHFSITCRVMKVLMLELF